MKNIALFLSLFIGAQAVHADALSDAVETHAQTAARDMMVDLVKHREKGDSWETILSSHIPAKIDDICGYRSLAGLTSTGFNEMKHHVGQLAGSRLAKTHGPALSRPGSQLDLVTIKHREQGERNQALVTMRVIPARSSDPLFSMLLELDGRGYMKLCDITSSKGFSGGVMQQIGQEINGY